MALFDANQLASVRAVFNATFLDLTANIQRNQSPTVSQRGHQNESFTTVTGEGAIACKMATPDANDIDAFADRLANKQAWTVRFPQGTDVKPNDQLVVSSQTLRVEAVLSPKSDEVLLSVLASTPRVR